jgi:hypothetical protein
MASRIKNIELLNDLFGQDAKHIIDKIEKENINISGRSTNFMLNISNLILNYVDFIHNGDFSVIDYKSIDEIEKEYDNWFVTNKLNHSKVTDSNNGKILFDYRKNGVGYYWFDLQTHRSFEMMFKMNNCGRVGINRNLIVLKEDKLNNESFMYVVIVIDKNNYIIQIKGVENTKPLNYYDYILDFFIKYEPIDGFKGVFNTTNDFSLLDLTLSDKDKLKLVKPHLFKLVI